MMRVALIAMAGLAFVGGCSRGGGGQSSLPKDFKLSSAAIALPDASTETFPPGPGAEAMDNNCRACHSPSMVLVQPPLSHEEWAKELEKMQKVYKASIDPADLPAIGAYLDALSLRPARLR